MKFVEDGVELIMIHVIEIDDYGVMKMTSLDGSGYNQNFYKDDKSEKVKLLPTSFRNISYEYDKDNRIKSIKLGSDITNIIYSGDRITEISYSRMGKDIKEKFVYNDGGEILVYDANNQL